MTVPAAVAETIDISDEAAVEVEQEPEVYTFAGLQIAPGPLYYNGTSYEIKDNWNYSSYNTVYGKNAGSTFFSFTDMGRLFEKPGFSNTDGSIDNLLDPFNGWRLPSMVEIQNIFDGPRTGSIVNGTSGSRWAFIRLTGISHSGNSYPYGLLFFPDDKTIHGKAFVGVNNIGYEDVETADYISLLTENVTEYQLNEYIEQGCVFVPLSGTYYLDYNYWEQSEIYLCSSTAPYEEEMEHQCQTLYFMPPSQMEYLNPFSSSIRFSVWLVKPIE